MTYTYKVINLNGAATLRVKDQHGYLVGYFRSVDTVNDKGRPVDPADLTEEVTA